MKFTIDDRVFKSIPNLRVILFAVRGVNNSQEAVEKIQKIVGDYWVQGADIVKTYPSVQAHPNIKAWRDCFQSLGISGKKFPSSAESLLKRALKQSVPPSINPIVDLYNAISVRYLLPFGAFDIDDLPATHPLELRYTRTGDTFTALDQEKPENVPEGEVGYAIGDEIVTRHINWRQSKRGLVRDTSQNVVFMSEVLPAVPEKVVEEMITDFCTKIKEIYNIGCQAIIMCVSNSSIEY